MSLTVQVTFDCADPAALSRFWNEVLGYRLDSPPPPYESWDEALDAWNIPEENRNDASASVDPDGRRPAAVVPEGARGQDRQEPRPPRRPRRRRSEGDERMAALEAKCARARRARRDAVAATSPTAINFGHIVMQDPEGNEFCLD